jgi:hypothetical protein
MRFIPALCFYFKKIKGKAMELKLIQGMQYASLAEIMMQFIPNETDLKNSIIAITDYFKVGATRAIGKKRMFKEFNKMADRIRKHLLNSFDWNEFTASIIIMICLEKLNTNYTFEKHIDLEDMQVVISKYCILDTLEKGNFYLEVKNRLGNVI